MAEEKLLTIRDVSLILGISEKEVINLAENGTIPAYKVGGVYLRFKRQQVEEFKRRFHPTAHKTGPRQDPFKDKVYDFFYFNDFYILSILLILLILVIMFQRY